MTARNIEHGLRSREISVSVAPVLAAAAIIDGLRSCLAMALVGGSSVRSEQVIDTVTRLSAAIITPRDHRPDEPAQGRSQ